MVYYSISELCKNGYKIRYISDNHQEIYKKYIELSSITQNKLIIQRKKKIITLEYVENIINKQKRKYIIIPSLIFILIIFIYLYYLLVSLI